MWAHYGQLLHGVDPSRHGLYCWLNWSPGTYRIRLSDERNITVPSFWSGCPRPGIALPSVDIPHWQGSMPDIKHTRHQLDDHLDGGGFGTAPPISRGRHRKAVRARSGSACNAIDHSPQGISQFTEAMLGRVERVTIRAWRLIAAAHLDLVAIGFGESQCVGHQWLHLHTAGGASADDPMMRVYRAIDRAVGQLIDACPTAGTVVVVASHGIGPLTTAPTLRGGFSKVDRRLQIGRRFRSHAGCSISSKVSNSSASWPASASSFRRNCRGCACPRVRWSP